MKRILIIILALLFTGCAANSWQAALGEHEQREARIHCYIVQLAADSISVSDYRFLMDAEKSSEEVEP
jgi:hypothetical protein